MHWRIQKFDTIVLLLMLLWGVACERVSIEPDNARAGYDYFPVSEGTYRIYEVYRINYNFASESDTLQFQVKELVSEKYLNQEGDTTFVLQRLSKKEGENFWKLDSVYHLRLTEYQAIELNNNHPRVKLVFPVEEGKTWNSNQLNSFQADSFKMVEVHKPFSLADSLYPNTLTVQQRNIQDTIVRQDIRLEVYALQLGPVYRKVKHLNYCATPECIGKGIINSGVFEEMKLKEYGKE